MFTAISFNFLVGWNKCFKIENYKEYSQHNILSKMIDGKKHQVVLKIIIMEFTAKNNIGLFVFHVSLYIISKLIF